MVIVCVPWTTIVSLYTPDCTLTVGIALFCAAAMAALIAVNCAEPSAATVITVGLDVPAAEDETVENGARDEEVDEMVDEEADEPEVEETEEPDVGEVAGTIVEETDSSERELD